MGRNWAFLPGKKNEDLPIQPTCGYSIISLTKSQNQSGARKPLMTGRIGSMYDMTCVGHRVSDGACPPSGNLYNGEE